MGQAEISFQMVLILSIFLYGIHGGLRFKRYGGCSECNGGVEQNVVGTGSEGGICGEGEGACCAGSNDGCPDEAPVCSEYGYCQCASYKPGGPECGPGFGGGSSGGGRNGGSGVCGTGQGACCAGSNEGCPSEAPVCSEFGYCQCASYTPGGPECGPSFGNGNGKNAGVNPMADGANGNGGAAKDPWPNNDAALDPSSSNNGGNGAAVDPWPNTNQGAVGDPWPSSNNDAPPSINPRQNINDKGAADPWPNADNENAEEDGPDANNIGAGAGNDPWPVNNNAAEEDPWPTNTDMLPDNIGAAGDTSSDYEDPWPSDNQEPEDANADPIQMTNNIPTKNMINGQNSNPNPDQAQPGATCGQGEGACCAGSNDGCPADAPVCSEYGYCQCASYMPGGPECGPGFGAGGAPDPWPMNTGGGAAGKSNNMGSVCGTGQGACCAGSNEGCPAEAPICSEYGYCQCSSYQPGGPECGPGFGNGAKNGGSGCGGGGCNGGNTGCGSVACGGNTGSSCGGGCWRKKRAALEKLINRYQLK